MPNKHRASTSSTGWRAGVQGGICTTSGARRRVRNRALPPKVGAGGTAPPSSSRYACAVLLPALLPAIQAMADKVAPAVLLPAIVPRNALGSVAVSPQALPQLPAQESPQALAIYTGPQGVAAPSPSMA